MVEYLYNAIRATAGEDIVVNAEICDAEGAHITRDCYIRLLDEEENSFCFYAGACVEGTWQFVIPAEMTEGLKGRFWYQIFSGGNCLSFPEPLYLI